MQSAHGRHRRPRRSLWSGFEPAWAVRQFRRWWLSLATATQLYRAAAIAQQMLVTSLGAGAAGIGVLESVRALPELLLSPLSGVLGDRVDRRRLIAWVVALQAIPPAVLALLVGCQLITVAWPVLMLVFASSTLKGFVITPAKGYTIALLYTDDDYKRRERHQALSRLNAISEAVAKVVIPPLATAVVTGLPSHLGIALCLMFGALVHAYPVLILVRTPAEQRARERQPRTWRLGKLVRAVPSATRMLVDDLRESLDTLREQRIVTIALLAEAIVSLLAFNINTVAPVVATQMWNDPGILAWVLVAFGVGQLVGALRRYAPGTGPERDRALLRWLLAATVGLGVAMTAAMVPDLRLQLATFAVMGWANAVVERTMAYEIGSAARRDNASRMLLWQELAYRGTTVVGALLVGFTMQFYDVRAGLMTGVIGAVMGMAILLYGRLTLARSH